MRRTKVVLAVLAAVAWSWTVPPTTGAGGPAAASAQATPEPTLTLTLEDTTGIVAHQQIGFTVSGLPANWRTQGQLVVCGNEPSGPSDTASCRSTSYWGPYAEETHTGTLDFESEAFVSSWGTIEYCGDEPFGCWVMVLASHTGASLWSAPVPIDVTPRPVAVAGGQINDLGLPTEVFVVGEPGATVRVAECMAYPGVPRDYGSCLPGPDLTLSATGRGRAPLAVATTVTVDGVAYDCTRYPCQATVFDDSGALFGVADLSGSLPAVTLTVRPDHGPGLQPTGDGDDRELHARVRLRAAVPRLRARGQPRAHLRVHAPAAQRGRGGHVGHLGDRHGAVHPQQHHASPAV